MNTIKINNYINKTVALEEAEQILFIAEELYMEKLYSLQNKLKNTDVKERISIESEMRQLYKQYQATVSEIMQFVTTTTTPE